MPNSARIYPRLEFDLAQDMVFCQRLAARIANKKAEPKLRGVH